MKYRITNLTAPVELPETELPQRVTAKLGIPHEEIVSWQILRKSLDARQRHSLKFVYSLAVEVSDDTHLASGNSIQVQSYQPAEFHDPGPGAIPPGERPVVVGSGPAGLLAGYYLALKGYRPLILERGQPVKDRVPAIRAFDRGGEHDEENNYLFGEGGAGCFSDGKLTCRVTGPDVDWVLRSFVDCGGRESLVYEHRPHLGSNKLPMICRNYRRRIEALGGEYQFGCRMEGLEISDGRVTGVLTSSGRIATSVCILAIGHSARDTYQMLHDSGIPIQAKSFQMGLRIEHPQDVINRHKYGKPEYLEQLGAADYSLVAKGTNDLFTFCMCAGGIVIPSISEGHMFCSNGMSNSRHDTPYANSGLVVTLPAEQFGSNHPLAGVEIQRKYEAAAFALSNSQYYAPIQRANDFLKGRAPDRGAVIESSYQRGTMPADLSEVLPPVICNAIRAGLPVMDQKWKGKYLPEAVLVGPEMRGSSPVRIPRDRESMQVAGIEGLYPVGEGAGFAGGIVTAAVDGLRAARKVVEVFASIS